MFAPDTTVEKAYRFSRTDLEHPLSSVSAHPIELEGHHWATAEHYFQLKTVASSLAKQRIRAAESGLKAYKIGKPWYRRKVANWKEVRRVLMTRALYTKVQMYPEVREALLAIEEEIIVETSLYDHYWGVGRDLRGENVMGEIWMDIRTRIRKAIQMENESLQSAVSGARVSTDNPQGG